jgi:hypothetical protein
MMAARVAMMARGFFMAGKGWMLVVAGVFCNG